MATTRTPRAANNGTNGGVDLLDQMPNVNSPAVGGSTGSVGIVIQPIQRSLIEVEIVGLTPLLVCHWSQKAIQMILDKQMKKANKAKEAKDPEKDYQASLYKDSGGEWTGIPAGGVKGCLVNACRAVDGLPMTLAKRMIFIHSHGQTVEGQQIVRINGDHKLHQAMVRIDQGTADIRFRAIYPKWSAKLTVEFMANIISPEQVVNLINIAGCVEGLCEHRPGAPKSHTGDNGRFEVRGQFAHLTPGQ